MGLTQLGELPKGRECVLATVRHRCWLCSVSRTPACSQGMLACLGTLLTNHPAGQVPTQQRTTTAQT